MELNNVRDAFDRVSKKQKLSCSKIQEVIDLIVQEIEKALQTMKSSSDLDDKYVLIALKKRLQEIAPLSQLDGTQKELNIALSKYTKNLEKSLNPDISKAHRNIEFDTHTVNQIIASHFYRQGLFDVGDCFINETKETDFAAAAMKSIFQDMYQILEAMKGQNLEPALKWAAVNSDKLNENGSDLQLKLHSLHFVEILRTGSREEALKYARTHLAPFASSDVNEIQKLMACLIWARKLDSCPYPQLVSPNNWVTLAEEVTRQFCNLVGQSYESPLSVTIAAGVQALPSLLKFMTVMAAKKQEWQSMKQLPVPVELDKEFQFHSIFVCPVSKEQSTEDNPPMMMPCGHVLCRLSITKMSKNHSRTFKCPYCPSNIDASQCKQLYF